MLSEEAEAWHLFLVLSSTLNSFVSMLREGITPIVTAGKCYNQM